MSAGAVPYIPTSVVELAGEIDLANCEPLGDALCSALDRTVSPMVVDLSAVSFIDSSGMAMMVRVQRQALARHRMLWWRGVQPTPRRALEICGLDGVLNFEDQPEAAR